MAETRTCANCIYYYPESETCHAHPPALGAKAQGKYDFVWPEVEPTDWCGQWMADFIVQAKPGPVY